MADPIAQSFLIEKTNYPYGCFFKSIKLFFKKKPTSAAITVPITLSIVSTENGIPTDKKLDYSLTSVFTRDIKVSETPHYLDPTTWTEFVFSAPVYIQPDVLYAFTLRAPTNEYEVWGSVMGDDANPSSVKNSPADATPANPTKISKTPAIGNVFLSQNGLSWSPELNASLMFTIDRCKFDINSTRDIQFVVPKKLPEALLTVDSYGYYANANSFIPAFANISNEKLFVDAFNVATSDLVPSATTLNYSYSATLTNGTTTSSVPINPGKYGSVMRSNISLADGRGKRILDPNTHTSFSTYASLSSLNDAVSPVITDAATAVYAIRNIINDCELSDSQITIVSGGSGYNANTTSVTFSPPTGLNGVQATGTVAVANGEITGIFLTSPGSGYIETPSLTITDANTTPGSGVSVAVIGETSSRGGNAAAKYVTKKVTINTNYDSGDLHVYLTAYRPLGTDIHVYYKIQDKNDTQSFNDAAWQLMTPINDSQSLYSANRNEFNEYSFAPGTNGAAQGYVSYISTNGNTYFTFNQFALKIVMRTNDTTNPPIISNFRSIALPADVDVVV
jgi:hypothetical protein